MLGPVVLAMPRIACRLREASKESAPRVMAGDSPTQSPSRGIGSSAFSSPGFAPEDGCR